jgi:hypothetical protein
MRPASVAAQGNGRGGPPSTPPGLARKAAPTSPTASTTPSVPPTPTTGRRLQTFGTWLDTAYVNASVSPTVEILNWSSPQIQRVNAVLPINFQTYAGSARFYGSTGYFTRGSVFGSGAAEWAAGPRVTFTTTIAHSYSVISDSISDAMGVARHRTDATGGVYLSLRPAVVFFASVGRTVSPVTDTSGRLSVTGGLTVNVAGPAVHTPRNP